jgi:hypothetical protein
MLQFQLWLGVCPAICASKTKAKKGRRTTEVEVLQELADGPGTAEIAASRKTGAQVITNYTYADVKNWAQTTEHIRSQLPFGKGLSSKPMTIRFRPCAVLALAVGSLSPAEGG